jgi:hypothetical protein
MYPRVPITVLAVLGVVAGACSDSADGPGEGLASGDGYSVAGALSEIPASAGTESLLVQTGDLVAASEAAGVERPDRLDVDAVFDWIGPLTGVVAEGEEPAPIFVPVAEVFNQERMAQIEEYDDALGWSLLDADAFVEMSTPPDGFAVVSGDFDDGSLSAGLEAVGDDGVVTFGEGDDHEVGPPTAVSRIGVPLRLAQDGDRIAASPSTPLVEDWLAGSDGSLADDESLADVAGALDDADVLAAVLTNSGPMDVANVIGRSASPEVAEELIEERMAQLPEASYDNVGIGWGVDDDGEAAITVAYHFADEDDASAAVGSMRRLYEEGESFQTAQPLSDLVTVVDVTADGEVVSVSLAVPDDSRPAAVYRMLETRDLPFISP